MLAATVQHCTPMQSPCTDCRATAVWRLWSVSSHCTLCLTCPGSWQRHKECSNLVHHSSSCKQVCHSLLCITLAPMAACTILRKAKRRVWTETLKNWPCFGPSFTPKGPLLVQDLDYHQTLCYVAVSPSSFLCLVVVCTVLCCSYTLADESISSAAADTEACYMSCVLLKCWFMAKFIQCCCKP